MGFYQNKINNYSKNIIINPDQMEVSRLKMVNAYEQELENLEKDIRFSRRAGVAISKIDNSIEEMENRMELLKKEIDFIKSLSTVDFYQFMIYVENYSLLEKENCAINNMGKYIDECSRYQDHKGLLAKSSALFGIDKKIINKNNELIANEQNIANNYNNARTEWNILTPEQHIMYLVGRFEIDGKHSFDYSNLEDYATANLSKPNEFEANFEK